jgi:TolA-binding protein
MDDRIKKTREHMQPPWDDVRQQRVLNGILQRRRETERRAGARRWTLKLALSGATAAAVAVLFGYVLLPALFPGPTPAPPVPTPDSSEIHLADGSLAQLSPGGKVEVEIQKEDEVRLSQRAGKVRYRVEKKKRRSFVVAAKGITVRVVGTVFDVEVLEEDAVRVSVLEGRVEVDDGRQKLELSAGEQLRVSMATPEPPPEPEVVSTPTPPPPAPRPRPKKIQPPPDAQELFAKVDAARADGRLDEAARLLHEIIKTHPKESAVVTALFMLGTVEKSRGRFLKAAKAFNAYRTRAAKGPLFEDALAEEASALSKAGQADRARELARKYLRRFPDGTHTPRMEILAK